MITGHIKALWGILDHQGRRLFMRRTKIANDVRATALNIYAPPYKTFVFGEDNEKFLHDEGFTDTVLIDKRPICWDMDKQQFRHKFEVFKVASEMYDRFVFTDWDMMFIHPIPDNFWDVLATKEKLQAIMGRYKRRKVFWRKNLQQYIPSGSFIYIHGKEIPLELIQVWKDLGEIWSEEVVICKWCENHMNNQLDLNEYWKRYEPMYFQLRQDIYTKEQMAQKTPIVQHFNMRGITYLLNHRNGFPYMRSK